MAHTWKPIDELPEDASRLENADLRTLAEFWKEQRAELEEDDQLQEFHRRLLREWSIETGLIERIYTLDRGTTQLLIEHGLHANLIPHDATDQDPEALVRVLEDHQEAVEGLFDFVKDKRKLSESYIKELHAVLLAHQEVVEGVDSLGRPTRTELHRGTYKKRPNNLTRRDDTVHEYCPPEQVTGEMERLVAGHREHRARGVAVEVEAAWLHHRFTQIHPFQDGNGRVARALATLVFLQHGLLPLVVTNEQRGPYIDALEAADRGDLKPLVDLFANLQRQALRGALGTMAAMEKEDRHLDQMIEALRDRYSKKDRAEREEYDTARRLAEHLRDRTFGRLERLASRLEAELGPSVPGFEAFADQAEPDSERSHWFRYQVIETAKRLGYFANRPLFHTWTRLVLEIDGRAELLISFHGIGREFRGLLVATATFFRREPTEAPGSELTEVLPLCDQPFEILYRESEAEVESRYERWLEPVILKGLEMLRRGG